MSLHPNTTFILSKLRNQTETVSSVIWSTLYFMSLHPNTTCNGTAGSCITYITLQCNIQALYVKFRINRSTRIDPLKIWSIYFAYPSFQEKRGYLTLCVYLQVIVVSNPTFDVYTVDICCLATISLMIEWLYLIICGHPLTYIPLYAVNAI